MKIVRRYNYLNEEIKDPKAYHPEPKTADLLRRFLKTTEEKKDQ